MSKYSRLQHLDDVFKMRASALERIQQVDPGSDASVLLTQTSNPSTAAAWGLPKTLLFRAQFIAGMSDERSVSPVGPIQDSDQAAQCV